MRWAHLIPAVLAVLAAPPLAAQQGARPSDAPVVVSSALKDVAVTVYRAPNRGAGPINPNWPQGFALVTETRVVTLPAGTAVLRFEGVSEGLLPETAVVSGMPDGVREKNRDARLLSPAGLVDAFLKRSVTLRRTDRKTGKVREQQAIIQAGPNGGVILQTAAGYEALGCAGLPERMLYSRVPRDLSAKPTLSILVESARARTVTLQLVYLSEGFDWAANYVVDRAEGGKALGITGWITVANGGVTSFPGAQLNVIAGRLNKGYRAPLPRTPPGALVLKCWPMDITSTHPFWELPPVIEPTVDYEEEVMVTAARLGDKLHVLAPPSAMIAPAPAAGPAAARRGSGRPQILSRAVPRRRFGEGAEAGRAAHQGQGRGRAALFRHPLSILQQCAPAVGHPAADAEPQRGRARPRAAVGHGGGVRDAGGPPPARRRGGDRRQGRRRARRL
ncbi:DUF4139 domain-containing protein [Sphingopyxis sp. PET50]|uniref:DUF4139 domain-containing protein n=1 Tax=Sphingopyxis sp. PET50 TaxID=2976533 RepID=UPI0021AF2C9E|nr:hypothetical protein [Sphingopyxis sp. PET50]